MIRYSINVTNNHDNQITARAIAACFKIVNHFLYLPSSPDAVSIWNHPRKQITNAIKESIQRTRLMNVFIVGTNPFESYVLVLAATFKPFFHSFVVKTPCSGFQN
ncbi:hypothetical protein J5751_02470 [bacterium]|nr:hypothetical protein [bacterium]